MKTKVNQKKDQQVIRVNTTENTGKVSGLPSSNSVQQQQADVIENSSLLTLQKKKLDNLFGATAQREVKPEEEELLQPKMVAQREVKPEEEEKLLQPKMVTQREPADEASESSTDDKTVSGNFHAKISSDDAEELFQQKAIQRKPLKEEEKLLQGKFESQPIAQMKLEEEEKLPGQAKAITQRVENKTGMPDNLKTGVEQLSGLDMSDVKVHYNSNKPASVQAHAYTQGTDIHVAPGQEQHLGHEAWHVAQQKQGRVQPTTEVAGMPVNDNPSLETEADKMGGKASRL